MTVAEAELPLTTEIVKSGVVPLRATVCGLPEALSATDTCALVLPVVVGANAMEIVQLLPAASNDSQVMLIALKSAAFVPVIVIELMVRAAPPVFFSVMLCVALVVPTACGVNVNDVGERETAGTGDAVPVPERATV